MEEAQLQHLGIVLSNLKDATVDWAEVIKARGTTRKDNAARDFKAMMKKFGIEYIDNKFTYTGELSGPKTPSEKKSKASTPRKRKPKADDEEDADEGKSDSASPKKKQKGKKAVETKREIEENVEKKADEDAAGDEED